MTDLEEMLLLALAIVTCFAVAFGIVNQSYSNEVNKLGDAICEQTYGEQSTYKYLNYKTVVCSTPEQGRKYDGLTVVQK